MPKHKFLSKLIETHCLTNISIIFKEHQNPARHARREVSNQVFEILNGEIDFGGATFEWEYLKRRMEYIRLHSMAVGGGGGGGRARDVGAFCRTMSCFGEPNVSRASIL